MPELQTQNVGDSFAVRDDLLAIIDGRSVYTGFSILRTQDGDPQFALIDNEGDVWVVTVKHGAIALTDEGRAEPGGEENA